MAYMLLRYHEELHVNFITMTQRDYALGLDEGRVVGNIVMYQILNIA
jgi:hypothetical protein